MRIIEYLSPTYRKLLLAVGLATFLCSISALVVYDVKANYERDKYYKEQEENKAQGKPVFAGPYCFPDRHPDFLLKIIFFSGLTFALLVFSKRYLLSFLSTLCLVGLFISWFVHTQKVITRTAEFENIKGLNRVFLQGGNFDAIVFCLAFILLFWQISIVLNLIMRTVLRKNILP